MATGTVPASFTGLKSRENGLGFAKSMDFVQVSDLRRVKFRRAKVSVIKNSNPGPETVELQPASQGSQLLGKFSALLVVLGLDAQSFKFTSSIIWPLGFEMLIRQIVE